MSNVKTADWAASTPWSGITGKPDFSATTPDISSVTAKSFSNGQIPQWNGKRFIGVNASSLVDLNGYFSLSNKPYVAYNFRWNPGTLSPLLRAKSIISIDGLSVSTPVMLGLPYTIDGLFVSSSTADGQVVVEVFNSTPYDITLTEDVGRLYVMR